MLNATEACPILSRDQQSMEFAVTRSFMNIFLTVVAIVAACQYELQFLVCKTPVSIVLQGFCRVTVPLKIAFVQFFTI